MAGRIGRIEEKLVEAKTFFERGLLCASVYDEYQCHILGIPKKDSPPCIIVWPGAKRGYIPLKLTSTVKHAELRTWCLVDTGCCSELVISQFEAYKLCSGIGERYTIHGMNQPPVAAFRTDDIEVEATLLHKQTDKPQFPDGTAIQPAKTKLKTVILQRPLCGSSALETTAPDVSWQMEEDVSLPLHQQSPIIGQTIVLGMAGIEKLGLELSRSMTCLLPEGPGRPRGYIL